MGFFDGGKYPHEYYHFAQVNLENFNVIARRMSGMFKNYLSLKELNLSKINTKNVISMFYMLYKFRTLNKIIHNFNTNNEHI